MEFKLDERLKEWATSRQAEYIDAINLHGSLHAAARALGVDRKTIKTAIKSVKHKAATHGYSPDHDLTHTVPEPYIVRGTSTYYDSEGLPRGQWVKSKLDDQKYLELIQEAIQAFYSDCVPIIPPSEPTEYNSDVIPWVQIGDAHCGLLTHSAEVGENFDLKIAERELCAGIARLIDELPATERLVINDLGDMTHYENMRGETEASGHKLDYDGRFPKMINVYSRTMRFIVDRALTKAKFVDVIVNQGNHSRTNDIWMAELLRVAYGHTERVNVLNNDSVFIGYRMGKTLVMTHHSDTCKPNRLAGVMITDFRKDFGETDFHYIDIGHIHHGMVMKEHPSIIIESFNHLAATDKWAHDSGYRNRKSITVVLRSKKYGEIGRRLLPIEEIRDHILATMPKTKKNVFIKEPFRA